MKLRKKIKGGTLVEVLIALTILTVCTTLAVLIFLNIQRDSLPFFKIKAMEFAEMYMKKAIEERRLIDENFKAEEFSVKKVVTAHELFRDCYTVRIIVFDLNKKKILQLESAVQE